MRKITFILALLCSTVAMAQFSESFEAGTTLPAGWTALNGGDVNTWQVIDFSASPTLDAHTGAKAVGIGYGATAHDDYLVTPSITVTAGVNDYLSFWGRSRDPEYPEIIDVKVSTTGATAADFTVTALAAVAPPSGPNFVKYSIDLSAYVGQTIYVGFHSTTTDKFYFDIDDVVSEALPACAEPNAVSIGTITFNSAVLEWTAVGFASDFQIEYGTTGFVLGSGTVMNVTGVDPVTLMDLEAGTGYDVYIRSDCGGGVFSEYVLVQFATNATPPANDLCDGATALTVGNSFEAGSVTATNVAASLDGDVPSCQASVADEVWFSAVVPADGSLSIETAEVIGSENGDTVIVAYTGDCGSLIEVDCNDDASGLFSLLNLTGLTPGTTLYFAVYQYSSIFGPAVPGEFTVSVYNTALANAQFDASQFSYYPNPVKDVLNISNKDVISNVAVYDLLGHQILSTDVGATEARLDVSGLAQGHYFAKVTSNGATKTVKLIKQ